MSSSSGGRFRRDLPDPADMVDREPAAETDHVDGLGLAVLGIALVVIVVVLVITFAGAAR